MNLATVDLGAEIIARIDALATRRGITRDDLLVTLVNSGLEVEEGALLCLVALVIVTPLGCIASVPDLAAPSECPLGGACDGQTSIVADESPDPVDEASGALPDIARLPLSPNDEVRSSTRTIWASTAPAGAREETDPATNGG